MKLICRYLKLVARDKRTVYLILSLHHYLNIFPAFALFCFLCSLLAHFSRMLFDIAVLRDGFTALLLYFTAVWQPAPLFKEDVDVCFEDVVDPHFLRSTFYPPKIFKIMSFNQRI